jgi:transcriptional regulator with XRE-family HTH domain
MRRFPKQNLRTALGLSQEEFALLFRDSESLVSMQEFGRREFPTEAAIKNTRRLTEFHKAKSGFLMLQTDNPFPDLDAMMDGLDFVTDNMSQRSLLEKNRLSCWCRFA